MRGKFITFEGCEGVGKTTQLKYLERTLKERGIPYLLTREPGGSQIAEDIRKIILDSKNIAMTDECEALLYAAARVQHLKEIVEPALQQGKLVVCDRYVDSSFAYQGYARGLGMPFVQSINEYALKEYSPNVTIFLDLPPKEAFLRKHGADENDRMEQMGLAFHEKVYAGYVALCEQFPRIHRVDCHADRQTTANAILKILEKENII